MIVDTVVRDVVVSLQGVIRALASNLTARDNFAPDGVVGQVLTSNGGGVPPSFQNLPSSGGGSGGINAYTKAETDSLLDALSFASLDGQISDVQVPLSAVAQHQAALSIDWTQLTGTPTTLGGYGITDAYTDAEVDALLAALTFASLGGQIADGQVPASAVTQHQAALSIAWSQITGTPATIAGYGITDAYTKTEVDALVPLTTNGDLLTRVAGVNARLGIGSAGQVLTVVSGAPAWAAASGGISGLTTGYLPYASSSSTLADSPIERLAPGTAVIAHTNIWTFRPVAALAAQVRMTNNGGTHTKELNLADDGVLALKDLGGTFDVFSVSADGFKITLHSSTTTEAPFNLPSGSAPTSPVSGDLYCDGTDLIYRLGSVDKLLSGLSIDSVFGIKLKIRTGSVYDFQMVDPSNADIIQIPTGTKDLYFLGSVNINGVYGVGGTQVLQARRTGWSAWTGTPSRVSRDTSTATTQQCAEAIKALLDDLTNHGLIGA